MTGVTCGQLAPVVGALAGSAAMAVTGVVGGFAEAGDDGRVHDSAAVTGGPSPTTG